MPEEKIRIVLESLNTSIERFADSKHPCAYLGLVPSLHQSGDVSYTGHITRQGNKWLRRNLIECARWSVRKDPHMQQFFLRVARKRGKKKARVAVARRIVSYAYWMLKRNLTYEELHPWKTDRGSTPKLE
jgi:transposase